MSELKVHSAVSYYSGEEQFKSDHWVSRAMVYSMKGYQWGGYITLKIDNKSREFRCENNDALSAFVCEIMGNKVTREFGSEVLLCPVPNSNMTVEAGPNSGRLAGMAKQAADNAGCSYAPLLLWKNEKQPTHAQSGWRSPDHYDGLLELHQTTNLPVVLVDDVVTSGSQIVACARVLEEAGIEVVGGVTCGLTARENESKILGWRTTSYETTRPPAFPAVDLSKFQL